MRNKLRTTHILMTRKDTFRTCSFYRVSFIFLPVVDYKGLWPHLKKTKKTTQDLWRFFIFFNMCLCF